MEDRNKEFEKAIIDLAGQNKKLAIQNKITLDRVLILEQMLIMSNSLNWDIYKEKLKSLDKNINKL